MNSEHPDWNAVLAHELRSPIAAILGYQELLEEGTLGSLPPAAADAVGRIRQAAAHLMLLIAAIEHASDYDAPVPETASDIIDNAISTIRSEADGRGSRIDVAAEPITLFTRPTHACRALALALSAAVKVSPGDTLHVTVSAPDADAAVIRVTGSAIDPVRDAADPHLPLTGAGFRLRLARAAADLAGGSLATTEDGTIELRLEQYQQA